MSPSVDGSGWKRPKRLLHLHLQAWRHASTLALRSGVMNVPSVSEDMFSHLSMEALLRGNAGGLGAESAPTVRKQWRRKQAAG